MIGVLVSGEGTNLQALIDVGLPITAVASNNTKARALDRAARAGIEAGAFPAAEFASREERDLAMADFLDAVVPGLRGRDVPSELAQMWERMCPAQVYEATGDGVEVTASNCVQCGAITAKGGRLTPPEGGSGPEYTQT